MTSEPTFLEVPCLEHVEGVLSREGGRDAAASHIVLFHSKIYTHPACVKDEGGRRKLLHYLVADKMDVEVAEW